MEKCNFKAQSVLHIYKDGNESYLELCVSYQQTMKPFF